MSCHCNSALNIKCNHLQGKGEPCVLMKPLFGVTAGKIWGKLDHPFSWGVGVTRAEGNWALKRDGLMG